PSRPRLVKSASRPIASSAPGRVHLVPGRPMLCPAREEESQIACGSGGRPRAAPAGHRDGLHGAARPPRYAGVLRPCPDGLSDLLHRALLLRLRRERRPPLPVDRLGPLRAAPPSLSRALP